MNETKLGAAGYPSQATPINQNQCGFDGKGINQSKKYQILLLLFTRKATAAELNDLAGVDDSRKYIHALRRHGIQILDYTNTSGCEVFYTKFALRCNIFNADDADFTRPIGGIKSLNSPGHE